MVTFTAVYEDGSEVINQIIITTDELPDYLLDITIDVCDSEDMENGFTILHSYYLQMFDDNGDTRWYMTTQINKSVFTVMEDGCILYGFEMFDDTYLMKSDMLGKIYDIYFIPDGVHHDIYELENGNILVTANSADGETVEDRIIELDLSTGEIVQDIDLTEIFDSSRKTDFNWSELDWIHVNTLRYDYEDDTIVISGRNQTMVAKLTYPECELVWIFADDYEWDEAYSEYLLEPVGEDFEWFWGQHTSEILPDLDSNPDTIDIMLFDNGRDKSFDEETAVEGENSYSRAVHYRINEVTMEVEQIWDYGSELGAEFYSEIMGDVDYYEENNQVIITSPAIYYSDNLLDGQERIIITEVNIDTNEVVFECHIDADKLTNVYRSERISIYPETWNYSLTDGLGVMLLGSYNSELFLESIEVIDEVETDNSIDSEILEIMIQSNELEVSGVSSLANAQTSLVFTCDNTSYKYDIETTVYVQEFDYSYNNIFERVLNKIWRETVILYRNYFSVKWLFDETFIPLDTFEPGTYTIGLMVEEEDGEQHYVETEYYFTVMDDSIEIENTDILDIQAEIDTEILVEYNSEDYTLANPYVNINPYGNTPLSALVMFETDEPASISIEVVGKDEFSTITHSYEDENTSHQIPVYGLYELEDTVVNITAHYADGTSETTELVMQGEEISVYIPDVEISVADTTQMEEGITIFCPSFGDNVVYGIDSNGDVRFVNETYLEGYQFEVTEDGTILMGSGDAIDGYYTESFYETDFLGKIYTEYLASGLHHDVIDLPNGNYMYLGENYERGTIEDIIMEVDSETGEVVHTWDLYEILELTEYIAKPDYEEYNFGGDEEASIHDWLHINSTWYDEETNSITISGRHQDIVMNFDYDTSEINWILTEPETTLLDESMFEYFLTPIGSDFEYTYANHAAMITDEGTLFVFDNGTYRIFDAEENYSRAVEYEIDLDNMTVEQIWEYGEELGATAFSMYVSDVDTLDNGNRLIDFGGIIRDADGDATHDFMDLFGGSAASIVVELNEDDEVVFEVETNLNSYRAERMLLYTKSTTNTIVGYVGERLSEETFNEPVEITFDNAVEAKVIIESATHNGHRLRINGIIEIPDVTDVYAQIDGIVFAGTIEDGAFSFDIGTSQFTEGSEIEIYYTNVDGDWFVDSVGVFEMN